LLDALSRGAMVAIAGAALITLIGKLAGAQVWPFAASAWIVVALLASVLYAMIRRPDVWTVARAADGLGLAERVSSALYAESRAASVADLLREDARLALERLQPGGYALVAQRRVWRAVLLGTGVLMVLLVAPIPQLGSDASKTQDAARVTTAQQRVQAMEVQPPSDTQRASPLAEKTREQLQALRDALARSETSTDAAQALENTQRELAQLPGSDDYAARRALDAIAASLDSQHDQALIPLARALRNRDAEAANQALAELSADPRERAALQSAANAAAGSQPALATALRRAASGSGATDSDLQNLLSQSISDAAALDSLEQTQTNLSQLRAATLPANATLVPARGTPTAYVLVRGTPPPNATLVALPGGGAQGGTGPQGNGQGGGAGHGDTPSTGRPSDNESQSNSASPPGERVAPNSATPTTYDPIYAPSRLGGEGGPAVQPAGDPTGARGAGVDVPNGPLTVGDVRPYDQVYSQYAQEARQSASRQSLPPNMQNAVDRYFGSIAPPTPAPSP
jgi:hypothetical protein